MPESADAERVIRDLAAQGNKIIFTTSFGYMEPTLKVAGEFPDVKFEHATGYKLAANMGVYDTRFYQDAYVSGIIAGAMTKSNTLGFVGSFPIPEVLRNINAFTLGAQSVNRTSRPRWCGSAPGSIRRRKPRPRRSLINAGADVLLQNTDSSAVLQTAEKNGKFAFGWDADMSAVAPKAHLASNMVYWGPYYKQAVKSVMDGTWKSERTIWGYKEDANGVIKINDAVPEEIKKKVAEVKEGYKAGSFDPFKGPIVDNEGKERLAADTMPDQAWKDKVDFYVKGVEGKIPAGRRPRFDLTPRLRRRRCCGAAMNDILRDWWLPLAAVDELAPGRCLAVQHVEQRLVLWQGSGGPAVFDDRCPHRGASLSLGRVRGDALECPYHGWRFAHDGRCVAVPAVPGFQPPATHGARAWQLQSRHGLWWVAAAQAPQAGLQAPPVLDGLPARALCGPSTWPPARRAWSRTSTLPISASQHEGWLGAREHADVPDYDVQADALGRPGVPRYRAWQPQASARRRAWVDYRYQLLSPLSALLRKQSSDGGTDEAYVLWTSPTGDESCRVWFTICTADETADAGTLRDFQQTIFAQDRPVLESQRPRRLPLSGGEVHSAADRFSAAYRRWLREIGFEHGCC